MKKDLGREKLFIRRARCAGARVRHPVIFDRSMNYTMDAFIFQNVISKPTA